MINLPLSASERTAYEQMLTKKTMTLKATVNIGVTEKGVAMQLAQQAIDQYGIKHVIVRQASYETKVLFVTMGGPTFRVMELDGAASAVARFVLALDKQVRSN